MRLAEIDIIPDFNEKTVAVNLADRYSGYKDHLQDVATIQGYQLKKYNHTLFHDRTGYFLVNNDNVPIGHIVIAKSSFCKDCYQVIHVTLLPKYRNTGLIKAVYAYLLNSGLKLVSDITQTRHAKALWKSFFGKYQMNLLSGTTGEFTPVKSIEDFEKAYTHNSGYDLLIVEKGTTEIKEIMSIKPTSDEWIRNYITSVFQGLTLYTDRHPVGKIGGFDLWHKKTRFGDGDYVLADGEKPVCAFSVHSDQGQHYVKRIFLLPEYRGQGIALSIYDYLLNKHKQLAADWQQTSSGKKLWLSFIKKYKVFFKPNSLDQKPTPITSAEDFEKFYNNSDGNFIVKKS
jgi:GNAT superfamily N-acetyltransferase